MSARKRISGANEHPLASRLRAVHLELLRFPTELRKLRRFPPAEEDKHEDDVNLLRESVQRLRKTLKTCASGLEKVRTRHESEEVVLGQIIGLLRYVAELRLEVGWRFVQLQDYFTAHLRHWGEVHHVQRPLQQRHFNRYGIPKRRFPNISRFAKLMEGQVASLEILLLGLNPSVSVRDKYDWDSEEFNWIAEFPSKNFIGYSLVRHIKNAARILRNYDIPEKRDCREFLAVGQVLDFWYYLDGAEQLLVPCEAIIESELLKQAQVTMNILSAYVEDMLSLVDTLLPPKPRLPRVSMDDFIKGISAKFVQANEHRLPLEELAGRLEVVLASAKSVGKSVETGEEDKPEDSLSWMSDPSVWEKIPRSGEQWVGEFDPKLRFREDTESLTGIFTLKDCIAHLKKILPYWVEYQFVSPKSDILGDMTHTIRCWLTKVRHDSSQKLPPIPPDLTGMVDWVPEVEELLAGVTTRKEIHYTPQEQSSKRIEELAEKDQQSKSGEKKTKNRPTKAEMANRNNAVAMAVAKIKAKYDRLPTVDEIIAETKLSRPQLYATAPYQEGEIAKRSAKAAAEMAGSSVQRTEHYDRESEEHSRADRRSKSKQAELDALIDEQEKDDGSDFVKK